MKKLKKICFTNGCKQKIKKAKWLQRKEALKLKKWIIVVVFLVILTGCGRLKPPDKGGTGGKINIIATIFPPYDFAREIAGDKADITMLLPPASESHSYEPTPKDIINVQNCDVFIYVGGESDSWVGGILESIDTDNIKIITLMDCVEIVEEEIVTGMEEELGDDEDTDYDEHVWTSPINAKLIVQKLTGAFCEVDSKNASVYRQNTEAYLEKLSVLDAAFKAVVSSGSRKTIVFGDRFPFRYFTDTYGLAYYAAFPGCSTETEASAKTVAFLIDEIKKENIPVIFHIELSNEKMALTISEATGAKVMLLHSCHNISKDEFANGISYLDLMSNNVDALKEALR